MTTAYQLALALGVVTVATTCMAYLGMRSSWQYYLTVDECLSEASALGERRVRVNGRLAFDSLNIAEDGHRTTFRLCGTDRDLAVNCFCTVPDNLIEGMDVVVEGRLDESGMLQGDKVITRCASKYATDPESQPSAQSQKARGRPPA